MSFMSPYRQLFGAIGVTAITIALLGSSVASSAATRYDWMQFNGSPIHAGNNVQETMISLQNVSGLSQKFQITLPDVADGAPVYLTGVTTAKGTQDLLFVTTRDGHIVALDAATGATVWSQQYGPGSCKINGGDRTCYTTSSPAIDPNRQFVYSYGLDGKVHKYQVADGKEITDGNWPEIATLKGFDEKGSSALTIATDKAGDSYLYVTNGGYPGDHGNYQGHITTINLKTGVQAVFNVVCSDQTVHFVEPPASPYCPSVQTAVWPRVGVVYDPATDQIYTATGNGEYDPAKNYWGDTTFALHPDGTGANGKPLDTWTPSNYSALSAFDLDIGSTAPAILPVPAGYTTYPNLAVQGGKDAKLRLLNLANLSNSASGASVGQVGGELSTTALPQGGQVLTAPAVWVNPADSTTWVFIANDAGVSALQLDVSQAMPTLKRKWKIVDGGTSPIIANGVLYMAGNGILRALNPIDGTQVWSAPIGGIHWESPIVVNGMVYVTDESKGLFAFGQ